MSRIIADGLSKKAINEFGLSPDTLKGVVDLDLALENGVFTAPSTALNVPAVFGGGIVAVLVRDSGRYAVQTLYDVTSDKKFYRIRLISAWGSWQEIYHTGNFDPTTKANTTGTYAIRATSTTKADVGLGNVRDVDAYSKIESDANYLGKTAKASDSDKLDGLNSTQFVRSDTSDTMSGSYTMTGNLTVPSVRTLDTKYQNAARTEGVTVEYNESSKSLEYNFF